MYFDEQPYYQPTMVSWVELVTKQFNASAAASEWFLGHMADDTWWPMQVRNIIPYHNVTSFIFKVKCKCLMKINFIVIKIKLINLIWSFLTGVN
jgi:hypothetical protein